MSDDDKTNPEGVAAKLSLRDLQFITSGNKFSKMAAFAMPEITDVTHEQGKNTSPVW